VTADLVAFLRARLDEDEQRARLATPGPWRHDADKHHHIIGTAIFEEAVFAGPPGVAAICIAGTGETDDLQSMRDATHIARHDPARVLAEVDAKRRIIDSCSHYLSWQPPVPPKQIQSWALAHGTLHLLALPYSSHPDYRPEWRP